MAIREILKELDLMQMEVAFGREVQLISRMVGRLRERIIKEGPIYVYIAGPISNGVAKGVRCAIQVADEIAELGYVPIIPHLSHFWDLMSGKSYRFIIEYDLKLLAMCHVLLRLPGESPGANGEVKYAKEWGIPVVYGVMELTERYVLSTPL